MEQHIKDWCIRQCVIQHATTIADTNGMLQAWRYASELPKQLIVRDIKDLGGMVDPVANPFGRLRTGPAVFMDGGSAADAKDIPDLLNRLIEAYFGEPEFEPAEFYQELMYIHPFKDGNGRVGALVYNILNGTINNPVDPPDYK